MAVCEFRILQTLKCFYVNIMFSRTSLITAKNKIECTIISSQKHVPIRNLDLEQESRSGKIISNLEKGRMINREGRGELPLCQLRLEEEIGPKKDDRKKSGLLPILFSLRDQARKFQIRPDPDPQHCAQFSFSLPDSGAHFVRGNCSRRRSGRLFRH
jgi:hypothetical protein